MAKSKQLMMGLPFPLGGLDRGRSYRSQAPFTSPDLENVRPFGAIEERHRGGSRPGIAKAFEEQLGSGADVTMLSSVTTLADAITNYHYYWQDDFDRTALGSQWSTASWVGTAPPVKRELEGSYTYSQYVGAVSAALNYSTSSSYTVGIYILPYDGSHHGTYYLYLRMDDTTPVATTDGVVIALTLSGSNGTYSGSITSYSSGSGTETAFSGGNTTTAKPGWLRATVSTNTVTVTWSGTSLFNSTVDAHTGKRVGFGMSAVSQAPTGYCLVDRFRVNGSPASGTTGVPKRTYLVAVSNSTLYSEQSIGVLSATSGDVDIASDHRTFAAERGQNMYIADWSKPRLTGTDGTIAGDGVTLDAASVSDWTAHSIDADNDIVVVTAGTGDVTNGTYKISAVAEGDLTLASTTGGAGTCSYRIERAPKVFDPTNDSLSIMTASAGTVPSGCRLICRYRDRLVLAGDPLYPNLWYMSALGSPLDWDTSGTTVTSAVSGSSTDAGRIGDAINALIPFSDDYLIFGCENSIWVCRGDPAYNGTIEALSYEVNMLDQGGWCHGQEGELYFLASDGLFLIEPNVGSYPKPLSREVLPEELRGVDPNLFYISMEWDNEQNGVHIWLTPTTSQSVKHWFWFKPTGSFWQDSYSEDHQPIVTHSYLQDLSGSPMICMGGGDGYVRKPGIEYESDDGTAITSYVKYSPMRVSGDDLYEGMVRQIDAALSADSDDVDWSLYVGDTHEDSVDETTAFDSGTWTGDGLQYTERPNARAGSLVLKLANGGNRPWSVEKITAIVEPSGRHRKG